MTVRFPTIRRLTVVGVEFSKGVNSRGEICIEPGTTEDSSTGTSESRRTGSETGSDLDGNRVGVFCIGSTTGTKGAAMVA